MDFNLIVRPLLCVFTRVTTTKRLAILCYQKRFCKVHYSTEINSSSVQYCSVSNQTEFSSRLCCFSSYNRKDSEKFICFTCLILSVFLKITDLWIWIVLVENRSIIHFRYRSHRNFKLESKASYLQKP